MEMSAQQTIGPYWHLIDQPDWWDLTRFGVAGARIVIEGRITDGAGAAVADAAVELFQASPARDAVFPGYGRVAAGAEGRFRFATVMPGPLPGPRGANAQQAPHCGLALHARGLLRPLFTRIYFAGQALNATDPVLGLVPAARRDTLVADEASPGVWRRDIVLQGEGETVFLDF
jgi:protocatechuate 3,4-dioxygenase alpha subunit